MKNPLSDTVYLTRRKVKDYSPRTHYFRDQTAIIHSMPFRRLKHKTQVFFSPENDHVCTRIEHVMHVASIAATICKGLNQSKNGWDLNEELAYAIGLGHDLGHAPFGHSGEQTLNTILSQIKFSHEINSHRVIEYLANNGEGLNLTYAVRDGIISHYGEGNERSLSPRSNFVDLNSVKERGIIPSTYEGCIVRFSDKIAYLGRDLEDALLAKLIEINQIPENVVKYLGNNNGDIIDTLVNDLINSSKSDHQIQLSKEKHELMITLKKFNEKEIYQHPKLKKWETIGNKIIKELFGYLLRLYNENGFEISKYQSSNINKLDKIFGDFLIKMKNFYLKEGTNPNQIVCDYVSGMTDDFALKCMQMLSIPEPIDFE